ncbi:MAG: creatininase family protein [bacterium]|nr:creatininase family protein [bacterium]MCX7917889.1 creatininase family protein [bacterium]MDW8163843.1 creatininase family protein [Candidatus Omnitrophota bacterium]
MKFKLFEMTLKEVREFGEIEVCVLPWGSCEPHNLHLPYGCDSLTVEKIAEISCKKANEKGGKIILLPTIPIGVNSNHFGFPMALHLSPTTQLAILRDIVYTLENYKIYKFVIINGHGGNEFRALLREIYGKTFIHIFLIDWWNVRKDIAEKILEDKGGEHGNEAETSWLMYLYPELCHLEWADDGEVNEPRFEEIKNGWVWITRPWHLLTENSGYGNPKKASPEKGKIIVENATDRIADFLLKLSNSKVDEKFPY